MNKSKDKIYLAIEEIIRKESERYGLVNSGHLPSVGKAVDRIYPAITRKFAEIKWDDAKLYSQFNRLVIEELYRNYPFFSFRDRLIGKLRQQILRRIRLNWKDQTIDKELAVENRTLAFKLSSMLQSETEEELIKQLKTIQYPHEVEDWLDEAYGRVFPLDVEKLLLRLKKEDEPYWLDLYPLFKKMAGWFMKSKNFDEELVDLISNDGWTDAMIIFREKVANDELPQFENAHHMKSYIQTTVTNKCREHCRLYNSNYRIQTVEEFPEILIPDDDLKVEIPRMEIVLRELDPANDYEISLAIVAILCNKTEPFFSILSKGIEDKVEQLLLQYYHGVRQVDLLEDLSHGLSEEKANKLHQKLRSDSSRTRKKLKERLIKLIRDYKS